MGFLIDTCIWIDVEQGRLGPADVSAFTGEAPVYLSPVTLAELRLGIEMTADPGVRQKRMATYRRMTRKPLLPIDADTADVFGELAGVLAKASGRTHRTRVQDLWLASQAIQHSLGLVTRNPADFDDIPGLELVNIALPG
ncbi:MAG TPA: type II toxin-antitoxin system VapC family toxin [Gammaproteobacteria bacterium]|nr:type II toxin-antitoxin system VapC family toxin [Gammaproteobacteria bacterium]